MYNQNFAGNRDGSAFQNYFIPPPPLPPAFIAPANFIPFHPPPPLTDKEFVKSLESNIRAKEKVQTAKTVSIYEAQNHFRSIATFMNVLKDKEASLGSSLESMTDSEWQSNLEEIEGLKRSISESLAVVNDDYLESLRSKLRKRLAKRMRLKRLQIERKKEKEEKRKDMAERSRTIDEGLQRIKDEFIRIKQEEEAKLEADIVLRDVTKKKSDAKKSLKRLDALSKLYKARQTSARGRGENVSGNNILEFNLKIDNLKSLWTQKLALYEKEENYLLKKLAEDNKKLYVKTPTEQEKEISVNLVNWREFLFGDTNAVPQRDFKGNVESFINIRSQWDQYISDSGTTLPIGWILPDSSNS